MHVITLDCCVPTATCGEPKGSGLKEKGVASGTLGMAIKMVVRSWTGV